MAGVLYCGGPLNQMMKEKHNAAFILQAVVWRLEVFSAVEPPRSPRSVRIVHTTNGQPLIAHGVNCH